MKQKYEFRKNNKPLRAQSTQRKEHELEMDKIKALNCLSAQRIGAMVERHKHLGFMINFNVKLLKIELRGYYTSYSSVLSVISVV